MDHDDWSADDLGKIVRDMLITALKSQSKLITGEVITDRREIERGE